MAIIQHSLSTRVQITNGTKRAVKKLLQHAIDAEQIWPGFQPIIDIKTGKVAGFEVLARWTDPDEGEFSPVIFITSLERLYLIDLLMDALIEKACFRAAQWSGDFFLAFNISPVQLSREDLPAHLRALVEDTGFSFNRIHIEITEGSLIRDEDRAYSVLRQLDGMGARIAIDDFGTGYSNLARLESFPFHKIKIDKRFVHNIDHEPAKRRIVAAIIGLGQSLGITVVAEGVERIEEEAVLRDFGCDRGQGWLYAKALKADDARDFLDKTGDLALRKMPLDISPFQRMHQLDTIYRNSPIGLCLVDLSFRHASVNDRFAGIHGMTARELEGRTIREIMDTETAGIAETNLIASRDTGISMQRQYCFSGRHVMIFSACIFDSDRTPLGYSVIAIDNSEQVRAMQYLAEREIHCRYIAQLSPDVEWSATADGIFDYISPIADDVLDGTMRERIERWFARIHPDDFPEVHRRWFEGIKLGDVYESEFRVRTDAGVYRSVRASALAARGNDGNIRKWYGVTKWL